MTDQELNASIKSRGRPATGKGQTIGVRMHDDLLAPIDAYAAKIGENSRPEAIRRILKEWLAEKGYLPR